ncbi:MAG TPA: hypothetical protein VFR90_06160 [Methylibium sp.]|uniref:hypothetical protein n=1 Tax=Methylibium sp. TaxID=2067992 RepID=UPI002DBE0F3B|nr:hypothetical protein [Methylibium sp.]HEU4458689.1 hypothetical protein [Methylibium sp.]
MSITASQRSAVSRPSPSMARHADAIEWEDLPSFANSLTKRLVTLGERPSPARAEAIGAPVWVETMPADLDFTPPSEPFCEPLAGLQTREVHEPEVFRLFFGEAH